MRIHWTSPSLNFFWNVMFIKLHHESVQQCLLILWCVILHAVILCVSSSLWRQPVPWRIFLPPLIHATGVDLPPCRSAPSPTFLLLPGMQWGDALCISLSQYTKFIRVVLWKQERLCTIFTYQMQSSVEQLLKQSFSPKNESFCLL